MSNLQTHYPFKLISKSGPTYMRQVVNPLHQARQGQIMNLTRFVCKRNKSAQLLFVFNRVFIWTVN